MAVNTLQSNSVLVYVHVGKWNPVVTRKTSNPLVSEQIRLIEKQYLKPAESAAAFLYRCLDGISLPFPLRGVRILNKRFTEDASNRFLAAKENLDRAVNAVVAGYRLAAEAARAQLGDKFREDDYPTEEEIRDCYRAEMIMFGVEDAGVESSVAVNVSGLLERFREEAYTALVSQFQDLVSGMVDRLGEGRRVYASSLEKFQDFLERFSSLAETVSGPQRNRLAELQDLVDRARSIVNGVSVDQIRSNEHIRNDLQQSMKSVLELMESTGFSASGVRKV